MLCDGATGGSSCLQLWFGAWLLWDLVMEVGAQWFGGGGAVTEVNVVSYWPSSGFAGLTIIFRQLKAHYGWQLAVVEKNDINGNHGVFVNRDLEVEEMVKGGTQDVGQAGWSFCECDERFLCDSCGRAERREREF